MTFRLQNKSKLALAAMIDVALRDKDGPVVLSEVGRRQRISQSYIELMFKALLKAGLVTSEKGPGGGYVLARPAHEISVADVLAAVDKISPQPVRPAPSSFETYMADSLDDTVHVCAAEILGDVTIEMLAQRQREPKKVTSHVHARPLPATSSAIDISAIATSVFDLAAKISR